MRLADVVSGDRSIAMPALAADVELVREVQARLIGLGLLDPPVDGAFGPVSAWSLADFLKRNCDDSAEGLTPNGASLLLQAEPLPLAPKDNFAGGITAAFNRLGYWLCRHPDCVNIVYIEGMDANGRPNGNAPNRFNDLRLLLTIGPDGVPVIAGSWEGTTEPGRFWVEHPMNPDGAARIAFGQYKSWTVGLHPSHGANRHEALIQVDKVLVYRDLNKDFVRKGDKTDFGLFGINQHWGYDLPVGDPGKSSAGCLVGRTKAGHRAFMAAVKSDARFVHGHGYRFMTTVFSAADIESDGAAVAGQN